MSEENNIIDFTEIKKYRDELNKLLEEHPELKPYQEMIEKELEKAGKNPHNRMAVINRLFFEQKKKLLEAMKDLKEELTKLKSKAEELKNE